MEEPFRSIVLILITVLYFPLYIATIAWIVRDFRRRRHTFDLSFRPGRKDDKSVFCCVYGLAWLIFAPWPINLFCWLVGRRVFRKPQVDRQPP